jgi:EAL domain-containing protein (putative c-di-GMP-specific phosphodiesterase class I)
LSDERLHWTLPVARDDSDDVPSVRELGRDDLRIAFQPIVDLESGRTFALEALTRCQRPGFESPLKLFSRAVEEQACGRLGRLVREVAFGECGDHALFVNIHPDELSSRWLIRPDDPLGFHQLDVFLEITEAAAFSHFDLCTNVLKELCARTGAHLVVDDFGAGYSNLQRILDLEPRIVKLDLALVRNIHESRRQQAVARHMVNLCVELGARVVAEGIEVIDELVALRDLGVHYGQGYFLAKPAFSPPKVQWPAEMTRPRTSGRAPVVRRAATQPAGPSSEVVTMPARLAASSRPVLVEEIVVTGHVDAVRAPHRKPSSASGPASRETVPAKRPQRGSRAPGSRKSKAPAALKTKAPGARKTAAPEARATRRPGSKSKPPR